MIISCGLYTTTYNRLKKAEKYKEKHNDPSTEELIKQIHQHLLVAMILLILEFLILIYALKLAIQCPTTVFMKVVHLFFALFFTIPYVIVMYISGYCPTRDCPRKVIVVSKPKRR
jgi:hypothetical protein